MYPAVVGCSSFSPHLSSCPSSSILSSQIPQHGAPHHHTTAMVHIAVAQPEPEYQAHLSEGSLVRILPPHNVTYGIVPPRVLSSTEKAEKCDPAAEAALNILHHRLYNIYFTWALNNVASPSLECNV